MNRILFAIAFLITFSVFGQEVDSNQKFLTGVKLVASSDSGIIYAFKLKQPYPSFVYSVNELKNGELEYIVDLPSGCIPHGFAIDKDGKQLSDKIIVSGTMLDDKLNVIGTEIHLINLKEKTDTLLYKGKAEILSSEDISLAPDKVLMIAAVKGDEGGLYVFDISKYLK